MDAVTVADRAESDQLRLMSASTAMDRLAGVDVRNEVLDRLDISDGLARSRSVMRASVRGPSYGPGRRGFTSHRQKQEGRSHEHPQSSTS